MTFENFIQKNSQLINMQKNEYVFMQGDTHEDMYFVKNGLLKAFYVSGEGKETIKSFLLPNDFIGSMSATVKKDSCSFNLQCLQDSQILKIPFATILQATKESHDIASKVIEILLRLSMKKEKREYEFLSLSAMERYQALCENTPQIIEQVTQNDIAHYLGITPVALSRIKRRVGK